MGFKHITIWRMKSWQQEKGKKFHPPLPCLIKLSAVTALCLGKVRIVLACSWTTLWRIIGKKGLFVHVHCYNAKYFASFFPLSHEYWYVLESWVKTFSLAILEPWMLFTYFLKLKLAKKSGKMAVNSNITEMFLPLLSEFPYPWLKSCDERLPTN